MASRRYRSAERVTCSVAIASWKKALSTRICNQPRQNAGAEKMRGIGSRCRRPPDVTGNPGKEGTDARGDRNTHPAVGRLRGIPPRGGGDHEHPDAVGPPDGRGAVLSVWRVRDLRPGRPRLDGAPAARSAVGHVAGLAGGGGPSRAVPARRGADGAPALRDWQGALHDALGGGGGARL